MSDVEYDVVIIGAGVSGLVAAYSLLNKLPDLKLLIIEKEESSGGQIYSGAEGELGGRWFSEDHNELMDLCKELKVCVRKHQSVPKYLLDVYEIDKSCFSFLARFELKRFFKKIDLLSMECNCNTTASETTMDMERYLCKNLFFNASRNVIRFIIRSICGLNAEGLKYTEFLCICQGTKGLTNQFKWLTKYSNQMKIEPNFVALIKALESHIGTNKFLFKTRVIEITQNDLSATLLTDTGKQIRTLVVIPAIHWLDTKYISFYPDNICSARKQYICSKNYVTSFIAEYDTPHWRLNGYSGFILSHDPHFICYESKRNTLTGVMYHDEESCLNLEEDVMQKFCLQFGHAAGIPVKWIQKTWQQSPIQGNYLSSVNRNVVWASADASFFYRGFLNGAVRAGQQAAVFALLSIRPQLIKWNDIDMVQPAAVVRPSIALYDKILTSINLYDILTMAVIVPLGIGALYFVLKR